MIYAATVSVAGGATIEVFASLGIAAPLKCVVTLQSNFSTFQLAQDASGSSLGPVLPAFGDGQPGYLQFATDRDPVYVKNDAVGTLNLLVAITAA